MQLTKEQEKAYIASRGTKCPGCGAESIYANASPEVDGGIAWQDIQCTECDAEWRDIYYLATIQVDEP